MALFLVVVFFKQLLENKNRTNLQKIKFKKVSSRIELNVPVLN